MRFQRKKEKQIKEEFFFYNFLKIVMKEKILLTTKDIPLTTYHLPLTTYNLHLTNFPLLLTTYHLHVTTFHLPLTTCHLPLTTYHLGSSISYQLSLDFLPVPLERLDPFYIPQGAMSHRHTNTQTEPWISRYMYSDCQEAA